jgi:hypothetical protein
VFEDGNRRKETMGKARTFSVVLFGEGADAALNWVDRRAEINPAYGNSPKPPPLPK